MSETAPEPSVTTMAADSPEGGPMVLESDRVLGPGGAASSAPPRAPAGQPSRQGPPPPRRANWTQQPGEGQNAILASVGEARQPGTVAPDQIMVHPSATHTGPPLPTGMPCTCAFEWEVEEQSGDVLVYETGKIATSFRGAPDWVTWCVVCGGEVDGEFRPDNAVRYGDAQPQPQVVMQQPQVDGAAVAELIDSRVEQLAGQLTSDAFLDALAERVAAKMGRADSPAASS